VLSSPPPLRLVSVVDEFSSPELGVVGTVVGSSLTGSGSSPPPPPAITAITTIRKTTATTAATRRRRM